MDALTGEPDAEALDALSDEALSHLSGLTAKRRAFVLAYSLPDSPSYADAPASCDAAGLKRSNADKLLSVERVRLAILCVMRDVGKAVERYALVDAAWIHQRLSIWANASMLDFVRIRPDGTASVDLSKVADRPEVAQLIDSVKETIKPNGDRTVEIRKISHARVIELAGKLAGVAAFRDVVEHRDGDRADRIRRAQARRRRIDGARDVTPKRARVTAEARGKS